MLLDSNIFKPSKRKTISSVIKQRALGLSHSARVARQIATCVAPNCTVYNVVMPSDIYLVRFSPDGQHLLAATEDLLAIRLYAFRDEVNVTDNAHAAHQTAFSESFRLVYEKKMPTNTMPYRLERRFCVFTEDSSHMILASERRVGDQSHDLADVWHCHDYTFYLINIKTGEICDTLQFGADYLEVLENVCVSQFNDLLAIVSLGYEFVVGFRLRTCLRDGSVSCRFEKLFSIGLHEHPDDEARISSIRGQTESSHTQISGSSRRNDSNNLGSKTSQFQTGLELDLGADYHAYAENRCQGSFMSPWKQHLLSTLLKVAEKKDDGGLSMAMYHRDYLVYESLVVWRTQLLDPNRLLIKMAPKHDILSVGPSTFVLFAIVHLPQGKIETLFDDTDGDALWRAMSKTNYTSGFLHPTASKLFRSEAASRTAEHCHHAFQINFEGFLGHSVASFFPVPPQIMLPGPYFDLSNYYYGRQLHSLMKAMRVRDDGIVNFYSREDGRLAFMINTNVCEQERNDSQRRYVRFIPHPVQPFIISILHDRSTGLWVTNFHLYRNKQ